MPNNSVTRPRVAPTSMRRRFLLSHNETHGLSHSDCPGARFCPCAAANRRAARDNPHHGLPPDDPIVIGNPLVNHLRIFPHSKPCVRDFLSHGFPSFTNCHSNQQQAFCCSNVIASVPANFLSLFSLSSCCLFSCTVCKVAEIVSFCVA